MRPKRQIFAGWAAGLAAVAAGCIAIPAAADKAANQRADVVLAQTAADFRNMPVPQMDAVSVSRLVDLYGPDSRGETNLQRVYYDLGDVDQSTFSLRKQSEATMRQALCMAEAIYYEARSESRTGQIAVAQVIQNRILSRHYPDTICDVVYQGSERTTGCQFSFTCDGSMDKAPKGAAWDRSKQVAAYVMTQTPRSLVGRSTHYHTDYVDPVWNENLTRTVQVGSHIFYRFPFKERRQSSASLSIAPPS
ncbi:MAG: cell wall hydrolase [Pseudomonadota bacterium]